MEEIKTQAIVLKSNNYKDSGRMLTIFSLDKGLMYAKINGVKKPKAKLAFASQPFCFGEFIIVSKYGNTVINCSSIENFYELTKNFDNFIAGEGVLEIVSILARPEEANPELFLNTLKALKLLNYTKAQPLAVLIKFLIAALKNAGYSINVNECVVCGNKSPQKVNFSFELGGIVCSICAKEDSIKLEKGEFAILKTIANTEFEKIEGLKFSSIENLTSVLKVLVKFFFDKTGETLNGITEYL